VRGEGREEGREEEGKRKGKGERERETGVEEEDGRGLPSPFLKS